MSSKETRTDEIKELRSKLNKLVTEEQKDESSKLNEGAEIIKLIKTRDCVCLYDPGINAFEIWILKENKTAEDAESVNAYEKKFLIKEMDIVEKDRENFKELEDKNGQ